MNIVELGNPIIRKKAGKVINISDPKIQKLIDCLIGLVKEVHGVGIAAPQIGKSLQMAIIASHPNPRYPYAPKLRPFAVFNPEILSRSKEVEKDWEGCLSIPGIRSKVKRSSKLKVRYQTRDGKMAVKEYDGFLARIFQHEIDHLQGKVYLDRLDNFEEIVSEHEFQELIRRRKSG